MFIDESVTAFFTANANGISGTVVGTSETFFASVMELGTIGHGDVLYRAYLLTYSAVVAAIFNRKSQIGISEPETIENSGRWGHEPAQKAGLFSVLSAVRQVGNDFRKVFFNIFLR